MRYLQGKHPNCLHEDVSPARRKTEVKEASSFRESRGYGHITSVIVPVWLSTSENSSHKILTYALLDTHNDTAFVLDESAAVLNVDKQPIYLSLSTMTSQSTIINSSRIQNLRMRIFKSTEFVTINYAYTRYLISADRSHIPERKKVMCWAHLKEMELHS